MVKGLYISATNLTANKKKLEVISNNLANIESSGYKADEIEMESFNARLLKRINGSYLPAEMGKMGASSEKISSKLDEYEIQTKRGFFVFETEDGLHFSKSGRIIVDSEGFLRSVYKTAGGEYDKKRGNYLLSRGERVNVGAGGGVEISSEGWIKTPSGELDVVIPMKPTDVGTISAGIKAHNVRTNFSQGNIVRTDNQFDFALRGPGFFEVTGESGSVYLTRFGSMTINKDGELTMIDGAKPMGLNGPVKLEPGQFSINEYGEVLQKGEIVDKIKLVNFTNLSDIYKVGTSHFKEKEKLTGEKTVFEGEIIQSHIEKSNVNAVTEMIKMIELNRNYESSQKVVNTIDEMLGKAATEIGKV